MHFKLHLEIGVTHNIVVYVIIGKMVGDVEVFKGTIWRYVIVWWVIIPCYVSWYNKRIWVFYVVFEI